MSKSSMRAATAAPSCSMRSSHVLASARPCGRRQKVAASTPGPWSASASRLLPSALWSRAPSWRPPVGWPSASLSSTARASTLDAAYAAMDFLVGALPEIAEAIFASTANLLNLACDLIFVDTSSTYFEIDLADEEVELAE